MSGNLGSVVLGFGILGLMALAVGIWAKLGHFRSWYLFKGFPGYPSSYIYGILPMGIGGVILAITVFMIDQAILERRLAEPIIGYGTWGLILISFLLMIWQPSWLKPWWLKWLENNYDHVLEEMLEEARDTKDFEQQTLSEDELAAWADRVARKHGW